MRTERRIQPTKNELVLVVEDDDAARQALADILQLEGFNVASAPNGKQALEYDLYRSMSHPYFSFNALAELRFKKIAIFINAINLSNVRQTRWDPLVRPGPGPGGNPITDVWAPLDGRTFNLGIRAEL